jgi:hypothetical protein
VGSLLASPSCASLRPCVGPAVLVGAQHAVPGATASSAYKPDTIPQMSFRAQPACVGRRGAGLEGTLRTSRDRAWKFVIRRLSQIVWKENRENHSSIKKSITKGPGICITVTPLFGIILGLATPTGGGALREYVLVLDTTALIFSGTRHAQHLLNSVSCGRNTNLTCLGC